MKKKTPPFEYLIEELVKSIELRHPEKEITEQHRSLMHAQWKGRDVELWNFIKTLSKNEIKAESFTNKVELEEQEVEFKIGVSLSGEDIIVKHVIQEKTEYEKSKNPKEPPRKRIYQRVLAFISRTQF